MLIDEFLPTYDVSNKYAVTINDVRSKVYPFVRKMDISAASVSMFLFQLRGIKSACGSEDHFDLDALLKMGFVILGEKKNKELLLGLIGKPWTPDGCLVDFSADEFKDFDKPGFAKIAWNFALKSTGTGECQLATETRVACTDEESSRNFGIYWFFVSSLSGLTRKEILHVIKSQAEKVVIEVEES
ncbi:MAG: hypothetical protein DWQ47_01080 [Acidobacteria bacterium]|nr:MAG: hypothetical protein DWQ32_11540 [Acidobacteriota bacterium]REK04095.1 MAG: hypothetical protein DWQ38_01065 [Acidobacteriota bacterium]REK15257.1 MAG: hypothetical protein DWQ43_17230 [Acidobacteriota bacterium]REK46347.1 MAG: hypothetical protein DWQ47_01080 [Acidobacteriota bacterium]